MPPNPKQQKYKRQWATTLHIENGRGEFRRLIISVESKLEARSRSQNVNSRVQDEPSPFFLTGGGEETRDKHETRPTKECKQTVDHLRLERIADTNERLKEEKYSTDRTP